MTEPLSDLAEQVAGDPRRYFELLRIHVAGVTRGLGRPEQRRHAYAYVAGHLANLGQRTSLRHLGRMLSLNEDQSQRQFEALQHFMAHSTWDPLAVIEYNARLVLGRVDAFRWRAQQSHDRWFLIADTAQGSVSLGWINCDWRDPLAGLIDAVSRARSWGLTPAPLVLSLCDRSVAGQRRRLHEADICYIVEVCSREPAGDVVLGERRVSPHQVGELIDARRQKDNVERGGPFLVRRIRSALGPADREWFVVYDDEASGAGGAWGREYWWSNLPAGMSPPRIAALLPDHRDRFEEDAAHLDFFVYEGRTERGTEHNWALGAAAWGFIVLVRAGYAPADRRVAAAMRHAA